MILGIIELFREDRAAANQPDRRRPRRQRAADCRRRARGGAIAAPISPSRRSSRSSATCRAICCSATDFVATELGRGSTSSRASCSGLPPMLVGLPEPNPVRRGTAALQHGGAPARRPRRAALSQGAAADLRRLRRRPLLRAVPRRADPRARRPTARHQHLRGRLERSRLLEAPPLPPRSGRRAGPRRRDSHRQPVGVAVRGRQARAGAKRCSAAWRASTACRSSYVNQFGGNDDLVFDGRSCAFDADGGAHRPRPLLRRRRRHLRSRSAARPPRPGAGPRRRVRDLAGARARHARLRRASAASRSVVLGLSGGIDSALTAADRRRGARRRSRARRADAVAVLEPRAAIDDSLALAGAARDRRR